MDSTQVSFYPFQCFSLFFSPLQSRRLFNTAKERFAPIKHLRDESNQHGYFPYEALDISHYLQIFDLRECSYLSWAWFNPLFTYDMPQKMSRGYSEGTF